MFGSVYEQIVPVTTADKSATKDTDLFDMQSGVNAIRTLTLWRSREKDRFFINNRSSYLGIAALHADDVAFFGSALVLPGQLAEFASDDAGNWYRLNGSPSGQIVKSLTAANINAMYATGAITVVPAMGAGRIILPRNIGMQVVRTSTQFAAGGAVEFRYTDKDGAKVSADMSATLITGTAGTAYAEVSGVDPELTPIANSPIIITNATQLFSTGTGTAKVIVDFVVHDYN